MAKIIVQNTEITVLSHNDKDYISVTDMANGKQDESRAADVIKNWIRTRYTIEFLGTSEVTREQEAMKYAEEADVLNVAMFGMTAKQWREANPDLKGNIRDYATINELICLSNMENINAVLINDGMPQGERLVKLNQIAIQQMQVLEDNSGRKLLK